LGNVDDDRCRTELAATSASDLGEEMTMSFVQLVEMKTSNPEDLQALNNEWIERTEGRRTAQQTLVCKDRDHEGTYVMVVEFPSYEAAMENSRLPETSEFAERLAKICDEPLVYRNLDVILRLQY
jgi:hypothetical protein